MTLAGVLFGLMLVWGLVQGWHRYAALWLIRSTPALPGPLVARVAGSAVVWRAEEVLRAPYSGILSPTVADGTFVAGGQLVARVGDQLIRAARAGQVWFSIDGWEGQVSPSRWAADPQVRGQVEQAVREGSRFSRRPLRAGASVPGGGAVGVLVDPFLLRIVVWLPAGASAWLPKPGSRGTVQVEWGDRTMSGGVEQVEAVRDQPQEIGLVVRAESWPAEFARLRFARVAVGRRLSDEATIVPGSALWVHDGQLGVFVLPATGGRQPLWFPVELRAVWSPQDQVGVTVWQGRLYPGGLGSGQPEWAGPGLPAVGKGEEGPYRWTALRGAAEQVQVAVNGVPAGAQVVTNPGWVAKRKLYL